MLKKLNKNIYGFSLMEVIVSLFIIMVLMVGIYNLIIISLKITNENKARVEATEIAKQKIEYIYSLSYKNVGTILGDPPGVIIDCETITKQKTYKVCVNIKYKDDPFDGLITDADPDITPNDYKVATVKVTWQTIYGEKEISIYTKIISSTQETDEGQGLLRILVTDTGYLNAGQTINNIPDANVRIYNPITGIDINRITDSNGIVNYIASSSEGYQITISHNSQPDNYSTDFTYDSTTNKTPKHLTVYDGELSYEQFTIDKKGIINIKTAKASNLPEIWQINNSNFNRLQKNIKVSQDSTNNLYFAWESETSTSTHIYIQKYNNNSPPVKQWANDVKISDTIFQKNPDIVTGDTYSYIVWQDNSINLKATAYTPINRFALNKNNLEKNNISKLISQYFKKTLSLFNNLTNKIIIVLKDTKYKIISFFNNHQPKTTNAAINNYYGLKVQQKTGEITGDNRSATIYLDEPVDPDHAFLLMKSSWSTGVSGVGQPDEHQATGYIDPSGMAVIAERSGQANWTFDKTCYFSFYVIEAKNEEFIVRDRGSLTIPYNTNTYSEIITENFNNPNKLTIFSNARMEMNTIDACLKYNNRGYAIVETEYDNPNWKIVANREGTINSDFLNKKINTIIRYEIVEWLDPLINIQEGKFSGAIGITENNINLSSSVIPNRTWVYSTMSHAENGLEKDTVRIYLKDANTIGYKRKEGTYNSTLKWWTIEFPRGVKIQRGTDSAGGNDEIENQTISSVVLDNTWTDSYLACEKSNYWLLCWINRFPADRWTETLTSNTNLKWERKYTNPNAAVDFSYQVIDTSDWDRPVEIIATGTQVLTLDSPSTDQYINGTFVISKYNYDAKIKKITISEHGSVDAQNKLNNIRLQYDIDNTFPYDCDSENYDVSDLLFGNIDTNGFSGANGTSTFINTTSINVSPTETMCVYVVLDVLENVIKYDTLDIKINNPKQDIILETGTEGYIKQTDSVLISGETELLLPPIPEQIHYAWREDDGDESTASTYSEDTFLIKKPGDPIRIRFSINNSGSKTLSTTYELKYGKKNNNSCSDPAIIWEQFNVGLDWSNYDSLQLTEASLTTNLNNLSDPNDNFISGYIHDQTEKTTNIDLEHNEFTEIEFSIISKTNIQDGEYCFRLEKQGDNSSFVYSIYPELTIIGDYNIFIQKINNSDGSEVWTKQVNTNENPLFDRFNPKIALDNHGSTAVVWYDTNNNIYAQKFDKDGNKLWNSGNDLEIASTTAIEQSPSIAIDSENNILITWLNDNDVYLQKFSSSTGSTLWTSTTTVSTNNDNYLPEIAIDTNDNYYIAWQKNNIDQDIYISKYSSTTIPLWSDIRANIESNSTMQSKPSLSIDNINSFIYVSWTDDRLGDLDIYTQKIDINTNAINWTNDYRINFNTGGDDQSNAVLILRGNDPIIAWQDNNFVFGAKFRPEGPTNLTPEPNVDIIATSTKTISENPATPKIKEEFQTDATGDKSLLLEYDFNGYNFIATSSKNIYVTDPSMPFSLEPNETKNIILYIN